MYELNPWAPPCGQVSPIVKVIPDVWGHLDTVRRSWSRAISFSCDQPCAGLLNDADKMPVRTAAAAIGRTPSRHNPHRL